MNHEYHSTQKITHLANEINNTLGSHDLVKLDFTTRYLYSTDASIYQILPLGVAFPRTSDDLEPIVNLCAKYKVPILARGAGSSLAGQAIGEALIIDCSKYLNNTLEINPELGYARLQPGVVIDDLNRAVKKFGLKFGPDPASSERATIGGSIANNATGAHSITYGMSADHLIETEIILSDGKCSKFLEILETDARKIAEGKDVAADIYRTSLNIRDNYRDSIIERWPIVWRKASGYNLNYLLPWSPSTPPNWMGDHYPPVADGHINLAPLFAGSEGTLGIIKELKVRLVSCPKNSILVILPFDNIETACDSIPELLELSPSAIELIPRTIYQLALDVPYYCKKAWFIHGNPAAVLAVEFYGDDEGSLKAFASSRFPGAAIATTEQEQSDVWAVRKAGLGILQSQPGDEKPIGFIEDVAVPVSELGVFIREIKRIMGEYHKTFEVYAHASAGCLHIRPILNIKSANDIDMMRQIAFDVVLLTVRLRGSISGEHGDGIARSEWLNEIFGPKIVEGFKELKRSADPDEILNPGKKVSIKENINPQYMNTNLRYGSQYKATTWIPILAFDQDGGISGAVEQCNGAGVCRKSEGVMCPSFQASGDEMHSTRGRANLLRAMISGAFPSSNEAEKVIYQALDLCLACKGCKAECPSSVDMAKLKYEYLERYYQTHRRRVRDYIFGYIDKTIKYGHAMRVAINFFLGNSLFRSFADKFFGITRERHFPQIKSKSLRKILGEDYYCGEFGIEEQGQVIFLSDAFTEYFYPEIGVAAVRVLEKSGCKVRILPVLGAGRTLISKGFLVAAKNHAHKLVDHINKLDPKGSAAIVGVEPSEIYTFHDEYLNLLENKQEASSLANRAFLIDEYLVRQKIDSGINELRIANNHNEKLDKKNILLHGHCYQKARLSTGEGTPVGLDATVIMLEYFGYQVKKIDAGCCGMAGAFGYESEHYEMSKRVGDLKLTTAINQSTAETIVAAAGYSCHAQIEDRTNRKVLHPIQCVYETLFLSS